MSDRICENLQSYPTPPHSKGPLSPTHPVAQIGCFLFYLKIDINIAIVIYIVSKR